MDFNIMLKFECESNVRYENYDYKQIDPYNHMIMNIIKLLIQDY